MRVADSLRVAVHCIVLSGVPSLWLPPCSRICHVGVNSDHRAPHVAPHPTQPSHMKVPCLEHAWPVAPSASICTFAGALATNAAAPPGCRRQERKRQAKAEGKTKGCGTQPPAKPVCTWGWRGTIRRCRRAAEGAIPAPRQGWPRASHDRLRHNCSQNLQGTQP